MKKKVIRKKPVRQILLGPHATCTACSHATVLRSVGFLGVPGQAHLSGDHAHRLLQAVRPYVSRAADGKPYFYCASCGKGNVESDKSQLRRRIPHIYLVETALKILGPWCPSCLLSARLSIPEVDPSPIWQIAGSPAALATLLSLPLPKTQASAVESVLEELRPEDLF